jgi:antitoxin HigA-1
MATRMHKPPQPGEILQDTVLASGITVTELARHLGVTRVALSRVANGRAGVSADMALRLAAVLGGSAESWLIMQAAYDLWQASKKRRPKLAPLKLAASAPAAPTERRRRRDEIVGTTNRRPSA